MTRGADSRLARMLRGELPEEDRCDLEARFLEDDAVFHELSREEEELLEAWEDGELDDRTADAVDGLLQTSTRVQTLVDMTLSLDETDPVFAAASAGAVERTGIQAVLAHRSLPWIAWGLVAILALALTIVLAMQVRIVRLLDQQLEGARWEEGVSISRRSAGSDMGAPAETPSVGLGPENRHGAVRATFDRTAGLDVRITLERTLLPGAYALELEHEGDDRGVRRVEVSLERTLFPGNPLSLHLPAGILEPGTDDLTLLEEGADPIASWVVQLVAR